MNERLKRKYGPDIDLNSEIAPGLSIAHISLPFVIRSNAIIGKNFHIMQGVTIGIKSNADLLGNIEIGDNVTLSTNSVILGNIRIGSNVLVGAATVVDKDIASNTLVYTKRSFVQRKR